MHACLLIYSILPKQLKTSQNGAVTGGHFRLVPQLSLERKGCSTILSFRSSAQFISTRRSVSVSNHRANDIDDTRDLDIGLMSFHSIHTVVDRGVLQAMWEELAGKVGHRFTP